MVFVLFVAFPLHNRVYIEMVHHDTQSTGNHNSVSQLYFEEACDEISKGIVEGFGRVDMEHVQLCPQVTDFVDENCISVLQ